MWHSLSDSAKLKDSLVECERCLETKEYQQILAKFPIRRSKLRKSLKEGLFKDKVLSDITNFVVKRLDTVYKDILKELFTSSPALTNIPIAALNMPVVDIGKI